MKLDELKLQLENYRSAIANVNIYKEEWGAAKSLIVNTLNMIIEETGIKAKVGKEEKYEGMEMVYLTFGKRECGISETMDGNKRLFLKDGGYLFYTQIYNGKISVGTSLPTIENFIEAIPPELIDNYKPSAINEELIIRHVSDFLKSMTEWEDQNVLHHEIGFKN